MAAPAGKHPQDPAARRLARIFAVVTPAGLPLCALLAFFGAPLAYFGLILAAVLVGISIGLALAMLVEISQRS